MNDVLQTIVLLVVYVVVVPGCTYMLWIIVRFSIISPLKTMGETARLRLPDVTGVQDICGVAPPEELVTFYKTSPLVDDQEFTIIDVRQHPPIAWNIGSFMPLTKRYIAEELKVAKVKGLPFASHPDGGTYYLASDGCVYLHNPRSFPVDLKVATTVEEFLSLPKLFYPDEPT